MSDSTPDRDEMLPWSTEALHRDGTLLSGLLPRLPKVLRAKARSTLRASFRVAEEDGDGGVCERYQASLELERRLLEARGQEHAVREWLHPHRIVTVRRVFPAKIQGAVDGQWVDQLMERRILFGLQSEARALWFYERANRQAQGPAPPKRQFDETSVPLREFVWDDPSNH